MGEVWKPVVGFARYEVSTLGRVRNVETGVVLKPDVGQRGYARVRLSPGAKSVMVHHAVIRAFRGPPPIEGMEPDHKNANPLDNRLCNLRWLTHADNMRVRKATKLTVEAVQRIDELLAAGMLQREVADIYGITQSAVSRVHGRSRWQEL